MSKQYLQRKRSNWASKLFCKLDLQPLLLVKELTVYDLFIFLQKYVTKAHSSLESEAEVKLRPSLWK